MSGKKSGKDEQALRPASFEGYFLISEIDLTDPNFYRTVVLITEHNKEGAFGLVVNRKTETFFGEVLPELAGEEIGKLPLYIGGPVQQNFLFVLHSGVDIDETGRLPHYPIPGVVFEPLTDPLVAYMREIYPAVPEDHRPYIRLFVGYSGWGPRQLEYEMDANSWFFHKATGDIVFFPNPEKSWEAALSRKGPLYRIIAETGFKPSMN